MVGNPLPQFGRQFGTKSTINSAKEGGGGAAVTGGCDELAGSIKLKEAAVRGGFC